MAPHWNAGAPVPVAVQATDLSQGPLRLTERPLDLALEGAGFLVADTPDGERLTRGGTLKVDRDGWLTDLEGRPVLGKDGPILIAGAEVAIHADGRVVVDGCEVATLRLETVADPSTLLKEGHALFRPTTAAIPVESGTTIHQGAVEEAKVDATMEMVDLVQIQRAYSANLDAQKAMDSVLGTVAGSIGRVG